MIFKSGFKKYLILISFIATYAEGKLAITTTTENAAALAKEVAKDLAVVESLTKGHQDPHYVEAKPSFMLKVARTDLLISTGLDLEIGWLPSIIRGARNPHVAYGAKAHLVLGEHITAIDLPTGPIGRDQGDVHSNGNPHFLLDPIRAGFLAKVVAEKLSQIDPEHSKEFRDNAEAFATKMARLAKSWQIISAQGGGKKVITYHKTLNYFLSRFNIEAIDTVEPNPGVAPTARHIMGLIKKVKNHNITLVLVEHYFEHAPAERLKVDAPELRVKKVFVSVGGDPAIQTLENLYTHVFQSIIGG